jgi:hypothetical protein
MSKKFLIGKDGQKVFIVDTLAELKLEAKASTVDVIFCKETETQYRYEASGGALVANDQDITITGDGGNTRWVGIGGQYSYYSGGTGGLVWDKADLFSTFYADNNVASLEQLTPVYLKGDTDFGIMDGFIIDDNSGTPYTNCDKLLFIGNSSNYHIDSNLFGSLILPMGCEFGHQPFNLASDCFIVLSPGTPPASPMISNQNGSVNWMIGKNCGMYSMIDNYAPVHLYKNDPLVLDENIHRFNIDCHGNFANLTGYIGFGYELFEAMEDADPLNPLMLVINMLEGSTLGFGFPTSDQIFRSVDPLHTNTAIVLNHVVANGTDSENLPASQINFAGTIGIHTGQNLSQNIHFDPGATPLTSYNVNDAIIEVFSLAGGDINAIDITHANLLTAIGANTLIPGTFYRITDYRTIHEIPNSSGAIHTDTIEPLTVLSLRNNIISSRAFSENYPQDEIWYDPYYVTYGATGRIYKRKDTEKNIETPYDFRGYVSRRYKTDISGKEWMPAPTVYNKGTWCHVASTDTIYISTVDGNTDNDPSASGYEFWFPLISNASNAYWMTHDLDFTSGLVDLMPLDLSSNLDCYTFADFMTGALDTSNVLNVKIEKDIANDIVFFNTNLSGLGVVSTYNVEIYFARQATFFADVDNVKINSIIDSLLHNKVEEFNASYLEDFYCTFSLFNSSLYSASNTIIYEISNSNIIGRFNSNMIKSIEACNIGENFNNIIALDGDLQYNNFESDSCTTVDFTGSTHVYLGYHCDIFTNAAGYSKLKYVDALNIIDIVDITD